MPTNPSGSAAAADSNANSCFSSGTAGGTTQGCPCQGSEHAKICAAICSCSTQWCVSKALWALDEACKNKSTIKAEVPYDMSQTPPAPYMSKNNPARATRSRPAGSRIPDVVITKDGSKPPTQDNIAEVVEIKYPGDSWGPGQKEAYQEIAGTANVTEMSPKKCGCKKQEDEEEEKNSVSGWAIAGYALLGVALVAGMILAPEVEIPALAAAAEGGGAVEGGILGTEAVTSEGLSGMAAANDNAAILNAANDNGVGQTLSAAFK